MGIRAVVAHSGRNTNGVYYSPEIMRQIAEQINSKPIPITGSNRPVEMSNIVGIVANAECKEMFGRYEVHADIVLREEIEELYRHTLNCRVTPLTVAMTGQGQLDSDKNITGFGVESFFFCMTTDHAMPYCRAWIDTQLDPQVLVDASNIDDLVDQFNKLWNRDKAIFRLRGDTGTILYTVGTA